MTDQTIKIVLTATGDAQVAGAAGRAAKGLDQLDAAQKKVGISAAQQAAAMRSLPAQLTDITIGLASGQAPLTVLLQQGGQLKDMFGGIGPAAKALGTAMLSALSPVNLTVAALGALGYAFMQGSDQSAEFRKATELTGNAAGLTEGQFNSLVGTVKLAAGVTAASAREMTQAAVESGQFGPRALAAVSTAMAAYGKATGSSAEDTSKAFAKLSTDAGGWAVDQNQKIAFLNSSIYANIRALQEQGRNQEAAALAAGALTERLIGIRPQLGAIENALKTGKEAWSSFWDAAYGVGRTATVDDQLAKLKQKLADLQSIRSGKQLYLEGGLRGLVGGVDPDIAALQSTIAALERSKSLEEQVAAARARSTEAAKKAVAAQDYLRGLREEVDQRGRLNKELEKYRQQVAAMDGTGQAVSADQQAKDIATIRRKYTVASEKEGMQGQLATLQEQMKAQQEVYKTAQAHIDDVLADGTYTQGEAIRQRAALRQAEIEDERAGLLERIRILRGVQGTEKDIAAAQGEYARLGAQALQQAGLAAADARRADLADARKAYEEYTKLIEATKSLTERLREGNASREIGLIADPKARALAQYQEDLRKLNEERAKQTKDVSLALINERDPERIAELKAKLEGLTTEFDKSRDLLGRGLTEGLKPEWQRLVEGWRDTTRQMREASDEMTLGFVRSSEDAFVQMARTGRLNLNSLRDEITNTFLRSTFRSTFGDLAAKGGQSLAGLLLTGGGKKSDTQERKTEDSLKSLADRALETGSAMSVASDTSFSLTSAIAGISGQFGNLGGQLNLAAMALGEFWAWLVASNAEKEVDAALDIFKLLTGGDAAGVNSGVAAKGAMFTGGRAFFSAREFARGATFTNRIVDSPTHFRFAAGGGFGLGLMGEAGPEAIMPLKRTRAGALGVIAQGSSGASPVVVNISQTNHIGAGVSASAVTAAMAIAKDAAVAEVADKVRRGARAFGG